MRGRASRSEFWWFAFFNYVVAIVTTVVDLRLRPETGAFGPTGLAAWLVFLLPQYAVTVRRLHDTDRPVWYLYAYLPLPGIGIALGAILGPSFGQPAATLAGAVTLIALFTPILWLLQRSQSGANRYGPCSGAVMP